MTKEFEAVYESEFYKSCSLYKRDTFTQKEYQDLLEINEFLNEQDVLYKTSTWVNSFIHVIKTRDEYYYLEHVLRNKHILRYKCDQFKGLIECVKHVKHFKYI